MWGIGKTFYLYKDEGKRGNMVTKDINEKMKKIVHYICEQCKDDPSRLGAVKLHKVLWFADSFVYKQTGTTISGSRYKKLQHGPVSIELQSVLEQLVFDQKLVIREQEYYGLKKKAYMSVTKPDTTLVNDEELGLLDEFIHIICDKNTAKSASELSHSIIWDAAAMGEEIPMYAVLATDFAPITTEDMSWADEMLERRVPA